MSMKPDPGRIGEDLVGMEEAEEEDPIRVVEVVINIGQGSESL